MSEQQEDERFLYPPRQESGIVGKFGTTDVAIFLIALGIVYVGFQLAARSWWWLLGSAIIGLALSTVPFIRFGGRRLSAYLRPLLGTLIDRYTGRGVFRGAVFAPSSLAHRMSLPGDLAGFRMLSAPSVDGSGDIGIMINDRERVAVAAMLTFGSSMQLADRATQAVRLASWEDVMQGFCAEDSAIKRFQLMVRSAPDVVNLAERHAREKGVITKGPVFDSMIELINEGAGAASRHEVYLVVGFDTTALFSEVSELVKGDNTKTRRDEALGVIIAERLAELKAGVEEADIDAQGWLSPRKYAGLIHTQFDPDSLPLMDVMGGEDRDVDPNLAGPSASERRWKHFEHDGAVSRTVWIHQLPKRAVRTNWLAPVLQQTGVRRTVSIVFDPLPAAKAEATVTRQSVLGESAATLRSKHGLRVGAKTKREVQAAAAQDEAIADGDAFFRYLTFVTVTSPDIPQLNRDVLAVRRRITRAQCQSLVLWGEQDQGFFAGALPLARALGPMRGVTGS